MLDFLVLSLPRSGSTWCANWLTTHASFCLHDPLAHRSLDDLAALDMSRRQLGAACTALWAFPDWCERHVKRVLILERDPDEVNASLSRLGVGSIPQAMLTLFRAMPGERVPYKSLFDQVNARWIWDRLGIIGEFDEDRHRALVNMNVQPNLKTWRPDPDVTRRHIDHLRHKIAEE